MAKNTANYWLCKCDCGKFKIAYTNSLKSGHTSSCGCASIKNITGEKFGKLTAIEFVFTKNKNAYWKCKCDCGNVKNISQASLYKGNSTSCGCKTKIYWNKQLYRSKLEVFIAIYLTTNNINFEYEKYTFKLNIRNKTRKYTPDFYIVNENKFLEIKGNHYFHNIYKIKYLFNQFGYRTELLSKCELEKLFKCSLNYLYKHSVNNFDDIEKYFKGEL